MLPEKLQVLGKISVPFKSVGWQRRGYWPRWRGLLAIWEIESSVQLGLGPLEMPRRAARGAAEHEPPPLSALPASTSNELIFNSIATGAPSFGDYKNIPNDWNLFEPRSNFSDVVITPETRKIKN